MLDHAAVDFFGIEPATPYSCFRKILNDKFDARKPKICSLVKDLHLFESPSSLPPYTSHLIKVGEKSKISFPLKERECCQEAVSREDYLNWMEENGFSELKANLEDRFGHPWDDLFKIRSPVLIQKLIDIYELSLLKIPDDTRAQSNIFLFGSSLCSFVNEIIMHKDENLIHTIDVTKDILGQLEYLIDKSPQEVIGILSSNCPIKNIAAIENVFTKKLKNIYIDLQNYYLANLSVGILDSEVALSNRIAIEIAKIVLNENGSVNFGLIDHIFDMFVVDPSNKINQNVNLYHTLSLLKESSKLRNEIKAIQKPLLLTRSIEQIIRASLNLDNLVPITDHHVRLALLTALLSHLRQGSENSCFAISLAIEILTSNINLCLKDLKQLLSEGILTRTSANISHEIPFITRMEDTTLSKTLSFNYKGVIFKDGEEIGSFNDISAFKRACNAIGYEEQETALPLKLFFSKLPNIEEKTLYTMSIEQILEKICESTHIDEQIRTDQNVSLKKRFSRARLAFSSETINPFLKIWENTIAGMAETDSDSVIRTNSTNATLSAMQFLLASSKTPKSEILTTFLKTIQAILFDDADLRYDPTSVRMSEGKEEEEKGAFILYHENKRVDTYEDYKAFIRNIIRKSEEKTCSSQLLSEEQKKQIKSLKNTFLLNVENPYFILQLLINYHPQNHERLLQISSKGSSSLNGMPLHLLKFTPWKTETGNDPAKVLKVYFESPLPIQTKEFIPLNAEDALRCVIEMCKQMPTKEKILFVKNPHKSKPFGIFGKHRLTFMAGNHSLIRAWNCPLSTNDWINLNIKHPGKVISESLIEKEMRKQVISELQNEILPKYCTPKDLLKLKLSFPKDVSIRAFRQHVASLLKQLPKEFLLDFDSAIYENLPKEKKHYLESTFLHFADTNWSQEEQDLHFGFLINPGTGELEMWQAHANGTHLKAISQTEWVKKQKWQFFQIPNDKEKDDMTVYHPVDSYLVFN